MADLAFGGVSATEAQRADFTNNLRLVKSSNFTAVNGGSYIVTANATVTDPTGVNEKGYFVYVANGVATIGGIAYQAGSYLLRIYISSAWVTNNLGIQDFQEVTNRVYQFDDFFTATGGPMGWLTSNSGGTVTVLAGSENTTIGLAKLATGNGASASDRAVLYTCGPAASAPSIRTGAGILKVVYKLTQTTALHDGTNTGRVFLGLSNHVTTPVDGIYFRSSNGGNWYACSINASTETATDTGIASALDTWRMFQIVVNAAGTEVKYYIDGVLKATHTTNLPATTTNLSDVVSILRTSTTAVDIAAKIDFAYINYQLTTPRFASV